MEQIRLICQADATQELDEVKCPILYCIIKRKCAMVWIVYFVIWDN